MSARRASTFGRIGLATSLSTFSSLQQQPSAVHARLSCGARKAATATKPFSSSPSTGGRHAATWDEDFTFHVPKTAACLKVMFFDDKRSEVS